MTTSNSSPAHEDVLRSATNQNKHVTTPDGGPTDTDEAAGRRNNPRRVIVGAGIGNALEWYDWSAYVVFAPYLASHFFNADNPISALLATMAVFAVGFLSRPLGGIYFGWLADRRGRRHAMLVSMVVTGGGSLLIGLSPTFDSIGWVASFVLVLARSVQGFGLGGEVGASHTFLAESAPDDRRGLWSSSMYVAVTLGTLSATLSGALLNVVLSESQMDSWGWRVPFLLGALLGVYGYWLRRGLQETEAYEDEDRGDAGPQTSMLEGLWQNRRSTFRVVGLTAASTAVFYIWVISAPTTASAVHGMDKQQALWAGVLANVIFLLVQPLWGALSDRVGRRPMLIGWAVGIGILTFPLSRLISNQMWTLVAAMSVILIIHGMLTSIMPAVYAELFPTGVRASGMAVPYSLTVAICGGTAPYLSTWLNEQGMGWVFNIYVLALVSLTLVTAITMPETKGKDLT